MGTAGSGDALSGVITGLLSQGYDPLLASVFGVYMHGRAGDIAAGQMGYEALMAGDIIDNLSEAYLDLFQNENSPKEDTTK
jgi:NAD(P)H-hydrate repair Nnr-like enzyme with NAD(P)H-hydrate dehydratase domain